MSDGTLRALGILTALYQSFDGSGRRVPFIGIEEPEVAVHPGAAGILRDALQSAAATVQIVVTSHSPDLLDDKSVRDDWILGVANEKGETKIGPIDEAGRSAIRDRLFTAGELLRLNQLTPDLQQIAKIPAAQLELFGARLRDFGHFSSLEARSSRYNLSGAEQAKRNPGFSDQASMTSTLSRNERK